MRGRRGLFIFSEIFTAAFYCSKSLRQDAGVWVMHACFCLYLLREVVAVIESQNHRKFWVGMDP